MNRLVVKQAMAIEGEKQWFHGGYISLLQGSSSVPT